MPGTAGQEHYSGIFESTSMADINLLPAEERSAESFENIRRKLLLGSIVALIITGILTIVVLFYFSSLSSQKDKLIKRVETSGSKIETLKAQEELIVVTKEKAIDASKILSARVNIADFFGKFSQLVPQNLYFSDMRISGGKLTASGRARTSGDMASFISALVSSRGVQLVKNVNVDSLSSDDVGAYAFVVNMQLADKHK